MNSAPTAPGTVLYSIHEVDGVRVCARWSVEGPTPSGKSHRLRNTETNEAVLVQVQRGGRVLCDRAGRYYTTNQAVARVVERRLTAPTKGAE